MRRFLLSLTGLVFAFTIQAQTIKQIEVSVGRLEGVSKALREMPDMQAPPPTNFRKLMSEKNSEHESVIKVYSSGEIPGGDPVLQRNSNARDNGMNGMNESTVIKSWDGINAPGVSPTDPCLAVGPNHVMQMCNGNIGSTIGGFMRIWDKNGTAVTGQIFMQTLSGKPGLGDCIPIYDRMADRWVITEMPNPNVAAPWNFVIMVSKTNDPTGQWFIYTFSIGSDFPDYPKYSLWSNAYYATSNDFPNAASYSKSSVYAFDRNKLLAGDPTASMIRYSFTDASNKFVSLAPVTVQAGINPSPTDPGIFMYMNADEFTSATTDVDSAGFITILPDFATPANSVVTRTSVAVAPYTANVCAATRGRCIPQPGTTVALEAIQFRNMHHVVYRDFGTHKSIALSTTVNAGGGIAAIRWYEFRGSGSNWNVYQQGTYSPDLTHRWMPSISMNKFGEIAIAYMVSSSTVFPGIRFAGRKATDPLGQLFTYEETSAYDGVASQTQNNRAGDYNDLSVDPIDDSTFWFTSQYYGTPSLFGGYTKIIRFDLAEPKALDARMIRIVSPPNGNAACTNTISPVVEVKNAGLSTLTSLTFNIQIDNNPVVTSNWTGTFPFGTTQQFTLPSVTAAPGTHTLTIYTSNPNAAGDQNPVNDTARSTFTVLSPQTGPIAEGFESSIFPDNGWRVVNNNAGSLTWNRTTLARKSGTASAYINYFNYSTTGHLDYLVSPILDVTGVDSVFVSFERAYVRYGTGTTFSDTLLIQVSTDCGNTFPITAWKKGGSNLATRSGTVTSNWFPVAADWLNEKVDIKPFIGNATSITVALVGKNGFGQNLFLDDINLSTYTLPRRDAVLRKVIDPFSRLCSRTFTPLVELGSLGKDTLKSVKIVSITTNGTFTQRDTFPWVGTLLNGQFTTVSLKTVNLPSGGAYTYRAYTIEPNGLNDNDPTNDTGSVAFRMFDPQPAPIKESFESVSFPPANWDLARSNAVYSWDRNTIAATQGSASAWLRNFRYNGNGSVDDLYSPLMEIKGADSTFLLFDMAHVTAKYPGSTGTPLDTLEVLLTTDCGRTFTSIYKKWGEDLQSVSDPNFPHVYPAGDTTGFKPAGKYHWRTDSVNLTSLIGANNKFQVVFRNINNKGNNIFLDNINLFAVTLPAKLKQDGYLIAPNPFSGGFTIRHYLRPVDLRGIQITNAAGQLIWEKRFNGNALSNIPVDLSRFASGMYNVKMIYNNKVVTERIVKRS
ncbi:MAG TPA: choice-of-anchor J domain-containing protein [Chitinophagaceae bacterium]